MVPAHPAHPVPARRLLLGFSAALCFGLALAALMLLVLPASMQWLGVAIVPATLLVVVIHRTMPEMFLVLFLFAGQFKANPAFARVAALFDLTVLSAILVILGMLHIMFIEKRSVKLDTRVVGAWYLLCCLVITSLFWTPSAAYGWEKAAHFVTLSSLAFLAPLIFFTSALPVRRFTYMLLGFSVIYSAFALQIGTQTATDFGFVALPGANYLGLASVAGTGVIIAVLYCVPRGGWATLCGAITILVSGGALLLSGGRGPLVALLLTLVVVSLAGVLAPHRFERTTAVLGMVLVLVFIGLMLLDLLPQTLAYRLALLMPDSWQSGVIVEQDAGTGRPERWRAAWEALISHPIRGLGSGGFAVWFQQQDIRDYPHNIFLEAGAEWGLPGLLVMIALCWLPLRTLLNSADPCDPREIKLLRATVLGLLCFYWIEALFSGDVNDHRLVWMVTGLLTTACRWQTGSVPDTTEARARSGQPGGAE